MSLSRLAFLPLILFALSGCETKVYSLKNDTDMAVNSPLLAEGFTHGVLVDTPFANIAQRNNGSDRLLEAALRYCGLPSTAGQDAIKFKSTPDLYLTSYAVFACSEPEKDTR